MLYQLFNLMLDALAGNANDYSSNGNNGLKNYNVTFVNSQYTRQFASSTLSTASFNGITTYSFVHAGNLPAISSLSNWTVSFWMYPTIVASYNNPFDANFNPSANNEGPRFEEVTGGQLTLIVGVSQPSYNLYVLTNSLTTDTWYHVVATRSGGSIKAYLNGEQILNRTDSLWPSGFGNVTVGRGYANSPERWFNGRVADLQIYNASLTSYQVQQLYLQGLPIYKKLNVSLG